MEIQKLGQKNQTANIGIFNILYKGIFVESTLQLTKKLLNDIVL